MMGKDFSPSFSCLISAENSITKAKQRNAFKQESSVKSSVIHHLHFSLRT